MKWARKKERKKEKQTDREIGRKRPEGIWNNVLTTDLYIFMNS